MTRVLPHQTGDVDLVSHMSRNIAQNEVVDEGHAGCALTRNAQVPGVRSLSHSRSLHRGLSQSHLQCPCYLSLAALLDEDDRLGGLRG